MATPTFATDITLDGVTYPASAGNLGEMQASVTYVPKIQSQRVNAAGDPVLEPLDYTTFHRGAGASRNVGIPGMVAWGENIWTCDPGILMPGPEVTAVTLTGATLPPRPDGIAEAEGHIFVAAGRYIFKLANGQALSPTPTQDGDSGATGAVLALRRFGSSLFASETQAGVASLLYERPDGGSWTSTQLGTLAVTPSGALGRVWWTTGGVTSERLVAQFGTVGLRYCSTTPRLDTSWTPGLTVVGINVGGIGTITRFVTTQTHLFIATTAGLMDLDSTGLAPNILPQAEQIVLPTGGLAAIAADGFVYYSAGYDLYRVDVSGTTYATPEIVTPMDLMPNETPVSGYGTAIVANGSDLIYAQYDDTNDTSWISWGRPSLGGYGQYAAKAFAGRETGPIVWNVAPIVLHGFKVTALHISGLASDGPRLWMFGTTLAGAVSAKWAPLAYVSPYSDLQAGRGRRFSQTAFVVLPAEDAGDDSLPKDVEEIVNENENLVAGNQVKVSARKENESTFTPLATFTSGPRLIARIGTPFVALRPTVRIDLVGTPLSPPVSRRVGIRWLPVPDLREVRKYVLRLGRFESFGSGNWSFSGAEEQVDTLVRLATTAARVNFTDEAGNHLIVRVLKLEGPTDAQGEGANDRVLMVGITLSVYGSQPGPPFGYDSAVPYDSGRSWS